MIVKGGHAIMLRLRPIKSLDNAVTHWCEQSRYTRSRIESDNLHMTLVFVGRNLPEEAGKVMVTVAKQFLDAVPTRVMFAGKCAMFGWKHDHLVALIERSETLEALRNGIIEDLKEFNIRPNTSYKQFNPHATIAKGKQNDFAFRSTMKPQSFDVESLVVKVGSDKISYDLP